MEYSVDGGTTWNSISGASSIAYTAGQFIWNTQPFPSGSRYRVRVTCTQDSATQDSSDRNFTIHNTGLRFYVNDGSTVGDLYCTAPGSDANDGLSPATPMATIPALLDAIDLEPGDTVLVDSGTYTLTNDIALNAADSGDTNLLVTIQGVPGQTVLIRTGTNGSCFYLGDNAYVAIQGFEMRGGHFGVMQASYFHNLLKNNLFRDQASYGVYVSLGDLSLEENTFVGSGSHCLYAGTSRLELKKDV